ncbi:uncharacterized protein YkwD [Hydrogenoanaerobacterium saccharovorans]|uniref:Uncharacterized conserved protein YkwD, contains CAP (CSP/antigen 5/PR1) domain n=1 Tax=Hydrogenoanaerobacterium saccharovorans TaxID=474960 RepID=A0A1H7ZKF4_9FIRM|nr:CAP domain-containing protein [Hydrogenoanaerobacterium saccharovorans]RPF48544.1 uncharacterized protein YkwD [Hydrogenoanaerobacterium saccharovorans]SEM58785.1 Uncharacterized conserved protein YkwD, contains CAP (CSP/antigen 5/PR1) domain [Hydrogenoanaerobacterium saccharovorans]
MNRYRILSLSLALCLLLVSCKQKQEVPSSFPNIESSAVQIVPETDIKNEVKAAMLNNMAEEFVKQHKNVAIELADKTLGIDQVESFYRSFLDNVPYEIYIGRYIGETITIYHLQFGGGNSYRLTIAADDKKTEHDLKEINKTENEYVFTTDKTISNQAIEVGTKGANGLTINNLCQHTWEHEISDELIKIVGVDKYEQWRDEHASRTQCNINIYSFLKFFNISHSEFMEACGNALKNQDQLQAIIKQVYPEKLINQDKPTEPRTTSSKAEASSQEEDAQKEIPDITGDEYLKDVEQGIIAEINAERESLGLSKLEYDKNLRSAARIRSRELYKSGVWDHTRPNGDPWQTVLREDVPIKYASAGENLANVEYNDPRVELHTDANWWFEEWKSSPSHYENICREEFTHIGAGVYVVEEDNGMIVAYATTIFVKY